MRLEDSRPPSVDGRTEELAYVLQHLWVYSFTTKSDFARLYADSVAEAASRGFITTAVTPHGRLYGRLWKPTPLGLEYLYAHSHLISAGQEADYADHYCK